MILALVGIHGLMANTVSLRTRDISVRVALGAAPGHILRQMGGWGISVTGVGLCLGSAASFPETRPMETMIIGLNPTDLATYLTTTLIMGTPAYLAAFRPAYLAAFRPAYLAAFRPAFRASRPIRRRYSPGNDGSDQSLARYARNDRSPDQSVAG